VETDEMIGNNHGAYSVLVTASVSGVWSPFDDIYRLEWLAANENVSVHNLYSRPFVSFGACSNEGFSGATSGKKAI